MPGRSRCSAESVLVPSDQAFAEQPADGKREQSTGSVVYVAIILSSVAEPPGASRCTACHTSISVALTCIFPIIKSMYGPFRAGRRR